MNIEDLIIKQINDSVSVKTKVLADEALRDKIWWMLTSRAGKYYLQVTEAAQQTHSIWPESL